MAGTESEKMIELPVVSTDTVEGHIEKFRLSLDETNAAPVIELRGITDDGGIEEQLLLARKLARFFLTRPYVSPLATCTLNCGKLIVEAENPSRYSGTSFGLAFLAGCLALGFQTPLRKKRLFTAALDKQIEKQGMPDGGILLAPVCGIGKKLAVACMERQARLFLYVDDEEALLKFEQEFWRGEAEMACLPYILPRTLSFGAVLATALDTQLLLKRVSKDGNAAFSLMMLQSAGELNDGMSFASGIGSSLATLRAAGKLKSNPTVVSLGKSLHYGEIENGEAFIPAMFSRCAEVCNDDSMKGELVRAAIASDPDAPLYSSPQSETPSNQPVKNIFDQWLDEEQAGNPARLSLALGILSMSNQIVPDMAPYWAKAKKTMIRGLERCLQMAVQIAQKNSPKNAARFLEMLLQIRLGSKLGRLQPDWLPDFKSILADYYGILQKNGYEEAAQKVAQIHNDLADHYIPDVFRPLLQTNKESLSLFFSITDHSATENTPPTSKPWPQLQIINDLQLNIIGKNSLFLSVPSPVLLMESCLRQHHSFCRRNAITLSDDTLSRYPINDAETTWNLFAQSSDPIVIGFQVRSEKHAAPATIRWISNINPWPPAIDTQFLVASMIRHGKNIAPRRILDVGCGTGYISVAAAHIWPSLEETHFLDIDPLATAAAEVNVSADAVAGNIRRISYATDFNRFEESGFDVLLCSPPYLPDRPLRVQGIQVATNGTKLLERVVLRGSKIAQEVWIAFSTLAWPEFKRALMGVPNGYKSVEIICQEFVPFRIPWLEPIPPEENNGDEHTFAERRLYYTKTLIPRGLIDLENHIPWPAYLDKFTPDLPGNSSVEFRLHSNPNTLERRLDKIQQDSRGYRFWHEVRVVRLASDS
jgi:SAM-dependent methyltransferase